MSKLSDPTICPDCRARLGDAGVCTGCGLRLQGPLASRLWETMLAADRLVEQLRAVPVPVPVAATAPAPVRPEEPLPPAPPATARPKPRLLPPLSVPVVLLSLGALCLLVAAAVFVVVTWSLLGITGRTLVLLGSTALVALVATAVTRRDLRGAAETLWLVVAGMLALDLTAARSAGLAGFDDLAGRDFATVTGLLLFALGAGVARWTARRPVTALWGMQLVAVCGAATATLAGGWLAENPAVGSAVVVPVLLALAVVLRGLPLLAACLAGIGTASWLLLVSLGLARVVEGHTWGEWWTQLVGWPLLVAAAYTGGAALVTRLPQLARQVLAGASLLLLAVLAVSPVEPTDTDRQSLLRTAVLVVLGLVVLLVRDRTWGVPAGLLAACGALVAAFVAVALPAGPLTGTPVAHGAAPWTHLVAAVVATAVAQVVCRLLPVTARREAATSSFLGGATAVAAATARLVLGGTAPVVTAVLVVLTVSVMALTWAVRRRGAGVAATLVGGLGAAYLLWLTSLAATTWTLLGVATTVVTAALASWYADEERRDDVVVPASLASATALLGGVAAWSWVEVTEAPALVLVAYAGLVALTAHLASRREASRLALEVSALLVALASIALPGTDADRVLQLSLAGLVAAVLAAWHRDRAHAGWVAVALAVLAVVAGHVTRPVPHLDLYAVPAALVLLAAGLVRGRDESRLGAGLAHVLLLLFVTVDAELRLEETVVVTVAALVVAGLHAHLERAGTVLAAPAAAALVPLLAAASVVGWSTRMEVSDATTAVALAVLAGIVLVGARAASRCSLSRIALEASSAAVAVVALVWTPEGTTQPMVLTIVGSAVAILAVTTQDRPWAAWSSTAILGVATLLRVVDDVRAPELYTLPAAALLLVAGSWRLRRDPECSSVRALGSGLTLGLVPSLLLALDEPVSARGLLLGAAAALLLAHGVVQRWSAPFAFGAATIALLALRQLGTAADVVPRWVTLGLLGIALLAVGVTWEARLRDLRAARAYVAGLR